MVDGEEDGAKVGLGGDHDHGGYGEESYKPDRVSTDGKTPGISKEPCLARRQQETNYQELHMKKEGNIGGVLNTSNSVRDSVKRCYICSRLVESFQNKHRASVFRCVRCAGDCCIRQWLISATLQKDHWTIKYKSPTAASTEKSYIRRIAIASICSVGYG